ncbi:MAG: isoleucine--tRNA ligase [Candidatus Acidiferrales bacterium]
MPKTSDLKSTLNLPRTAFPMKANLPQNEPKQLAEWEAAGLYHRIQKARAGAPSYVLHDGPPYPTGTIHLGTALNKILKDMVVKSKTMAGFRSPFVPGWDCHGLPIETQVEKELGRKGAVSPAEFREKCREFALKYVDQHRRDFKRLGVFGQWEKPYLTMNPEYEACVADAFLTFLEKGYAYRGLKPVYWCIHDQTALAEAEVEYEDHASPSIWVRYKVLESRVPQVGGSGALYALVWTTTPWTLPSSMALAFHPDFSYVVARDPKTGDAYLLALDLLSSASRETGLELEPVGEAFYGNLLEGAKFQHPFLDRVIPGVLGKHVTLEQGSGIVHTAPGHGAEDFVVGQEYGLETYAPLDNAGRFTEGLPEYKGKSVFEANPLIIDLLERRGALVYQTKLSHSYPHCWRCHNPVIFRATEQWFFRLDAASKTPGAAPGTLRERALAEIPRITWTPAWGNERMRQMVAERPDWCVSRQRFWGVPIVVFYCAACNKRLEDVKVLRSVIEWFKREGADAWFSHSAEELLPAGTRCSCGGAKWRKENDILDVWFDSGCSNLTVLGSAELPWPADLYLEGPDQFRGWFHSSLLVAEGVREASPYKNVLTYGWALDEKGRPMSKSLGNVVLPSEVSEKWGADLLRLWVAAHDYTADIWMSENGMQQLAESYRKIRNTFRFVLGNLSDFDPGRDALPDAQLEEFDRYMLARTADLVERCRAWYESFEFHRVFHAVYDFAAVDLSAFYFDILKDRLYTFAPRNRARRSAQTAVYRIASALLRLIAPLLVFTAEEIWREFPRGADASDRESVHLALFPSPGELGAPLDQAARANWDRLLEVRTEVLRALEAARNAKTISSGLEAKVIIEAGPDLERLLTKYAGSLPALFLVSQVESKKSQLAIPVDIPVHVERAEGAKCERCWNYSIHVGENAAYPTICERCTAALAEIERDPARGTDGAAPGAASK